MHLTMSNLAHLACFVCCAQPAKHAVPCLAAVQRWFPEFQEKSGLEFNFLDSTGGVCGVPSGLAESCEGTVN